MPRVALVTNSLTPYRVPVFRRLAEAGDLELRVLVSAESTPDRTWQVTSDGLDVERVEGFDLRLAGRALHLPVGLVRALWRLRPDVVVSGELGARTLFAWLACAALRVPLVVWSYPTPAGVARAPAWRIRWRRFLLGRATAVIGMGAQARRVLLDWGVPAERLFDAPNAHDIDGMRKALSAIDPEIADRALRAGLGCRARVILFVGRLLPRKGVRELLDAWDAIPPGLREDWTLLWVGSGPLEEEVRTAQHRHRRGEVVHVPALPPADVYPLYATADLLVFPSLVEPWGLVVNEAMESDLPVLCSHRAGCADDLMRDGENGWVFDPADPEAFRAALERALTCGARRRLGERAGESAARFRPERMAEGMSRAIEVALDRRRR